MKPLTSEEHLQRIIEKATPYGEQEGGFIAYYIIPTGPIHRAILHLQQNGIPVPNPPRDVPVFPTDVQVQAAARADYEYSYHDADDRDFDHLPFDNRKSYIVKALAVLKAAHHIRKDEK